MAGDERDPTSPIERARGAVALLREGTITIALVALVLVFAVSPSRIGQMLKAANVKSVDVAGINIETELQQANERLAKSTARLDEAQTQLSSAMKSVAVARESVDRITTLYKLEPGARSELSSITRSLATSQNGLEASQRRVLTAKSLLDSSAVAQRQLLMRIRPSTK